MNATLLLDYATFNFDTGSVDLASLSSCISPDSDLKFKPVSLTSENSPMLSPFGFYYMDNNGFAARRHKLQVSGVGCSHFEANLPYVRSLAPNHLSRCDFAFDVVMSREDWHKYLVKVIDKSFSQDRDSKKYTFAGSGEAVTVYIGSRKCAKFCRIYNKTLENPDYFAVIDGEKIQPVKDDKGVFGQYIIRYEVEFKRFKSKVQDFDPSFLFDSYFGDSSVVVDYVLNVWRLYAEDFMLPCDLSELVLSIRYDKQKFCSKQSSDMFINDTLYDKPRVFDSTVDFIASRYGKYIPFVLVNPFLRNLVLQQCEAFCGFKLDLVVSVCESGFYDNEISEKECEKVNLSSVDNQLPTYEQLSI